MLSTFQKCFLTACFFIVLNSCGGASNGKVRLTLIPNIGRQQGFHNLQKELLNRLITPGTPQCVQAQIFAGLKTSSAQNAPIEVFPIQMTTDYNFGGSPTNWDWLNVHTTISGPITIDIPKDQDVEVGIIGAFYLPPVVSGVLQDATCAHNADTTINHSLSILGHGHVTAHTSTSLPLNVWFAQSTYITETTPSPSPGSGGYVSDDARKNFTAVNWSYSIANTNALAAHYLYGTDGVYHIFHEFAPAPSSPTWLILPQVNPIQVDAQYLYAGSSVANQSLTVTNSFQGPTATPIAFPTPSGDFSPAPLITVQDIGSF